MSYYTKVMRKNHFKNIPKFKNTNTNKKWKKGYQSGWIGLFLSSVGITLVVNTSESIGMIFPINYLHIFLLLSESLTSQEIMQ